jgi:hypothetical protein
MHLSHPKVNLLARQLFLAADLVPSEIAKQSSFSFAKQVPKAATLAMRRTWWPLSQDVVKRRGSLVLLAHPCNPSYLGGRDQEDHSSKPAWVSRLSNPISKNPSQK